MDNLKFIFTWLTTADWKSSETIKWMGKLSVWIVLAYNVIIIKAQFTKQMHHTIITCRRCFSWMKFSLINCYFSPSSLGDNWISFRVSNNVRQLLLWKLIFLSELLSNKEFSLVVIYLAFVLWNIKLLFMMKSTYSYYQTITSNQLE